MPYEEMIGAVLGAVSRARQDAGKTRAAVLLALEARTDPAAVRRAATAAIDQERTLAEAEKAAHELLTAALCVPVMFALGGDEPLSPDEYEELLKLVRVWVADAERDEDGGWRPAAMTGEKSS